MAKGKKSPTTAADTRPAPRIGPTDHTPESFPIIAIGASAGGLEALEQFFSRVPPNSGAAFVVIQHMDPTRKGMLPELLGRVAKIAVIQAAHDMPVKPDNIYVIAPNKDMSILRGALQLFEPAEARGLRSPIDFFFRALAEDRPRTGVGIILSGMGSDGALGLRAIRDKGGLTAVQEPSSAKFDGMPRSALDATPADIVAPADELAGQVLGVLHPGSAESPKNLDLERQSALEKVLILLRSHTGADFSQYKKSTLYRRIERRMGSHLVSRIADYLRVLRENPQEVEMPYQELLIGVTSFFRDPDAWATLKAQALPLLVDNAAPRRTLRAWVPACASGEEAYSLAILFKELSESLGSPPPLSLQLRRFTPAMTRIIKLLASDIGRPLNDLATNLNYPDMFRDALEMLRTLVFSEKEVPAIDGRWFIVRIMPYRTLDNVIDGVVITFLDVTKAKKLEGDLEAVRPEGG